MAAVPPDALIVWAVPLSALRASTPRSPAPHPPHDDRSPIVVLGGRIRCFCSRHRCPSGRSITNVSFSEGEPNASRERQHQALLVSGVGSWVSAANRRSCAQQEQRQNGPGRTVPTGGSGAGPPVTRMSSLISAIVTGRACSRPHERQRSGPAGGLRAASSFIRRALKVETNRYSYSLSSIHGA
jgi:hypothetical protein